MSQINWAKVYAAMDQRIDLKYDQLPKGEQIGKCTPRASSQTKSA